MLLESSSNVIKTHLQHCFCVQVLQVIEVYFYTVAKPVLPAPRIKKASFLILYYLDCWKGIKLSEGIGWTNC